MSSDRPDNPRDDNGTNDELMNGWDDSESTNTEAEGNDSATDQDIVDEEFDDQYDGEYEDQFGDEYDGDEYEGEDDEEFDDDDHRVRKSTRRVRLFCFHCARDESFFLANKGRWTHSFLFGMTFGAIQFIGPFKCQCCGHNRLMKWNVMNPKFWKKQKDSAKAK